MASAHVAHGLLDWLRDLINTTRMLACRYNAILSRHMPRHEYHVDPALPWRGGNHDSMEPRFGARYARHTALATVLMRLIHCCMALCNPKDLTTALCQACGEAPKLGYFAHFGVVLTQLPTAVNGRHGVGAWHSWAP